MRESCAGRCDLVSDYFAQPWASAPLEHRGVAGRAPKTRESRRRRRRGGGDWEGAQPLPRKFMNFSSQNSVIWCILGVLFLRFICVPRGLTAICVIQNSSAEGKKTKHLSKYWGGSSTQDDPCRSNIGGSRPLRR